MAITAPQALQVRFVLCFSHPSVWLVFLLHCGQVMSMRCESSLFSMSVPSLSGVDVVRNTDSTGPGTGAIQSQGRAAVARRVHTPEVAGSIPALATSKPLAGRLPAVSQSL